VRRIYLSPPDIGDAERRLVMDAFDSNWVAPLGPHVDSFEREVADVVGCRHAAALSSGTAALHLALLMLGVGRGDRVFCSTFTFSASANPIVYQGAEPVFIESEPGSWNMHPGLLEEELAASARAGRLPKAVVVVDLYGQSADYDPIRAACARYDVPIVEDAAEALGASYKGRPAGSFGKLGVLSFNGNKIITTSGGGMLVADDAGLIERARFLATQARDPAPHYQHSTIGYNYRLSNICAAIGRGQLADLERRVARRRAIHDRYTRALSELPGLTFMPEAPYGHANRWLTCILVESELFGASHEEVRVALESANIEARPLWKPLHMQPVFSDCQYVGNRFSEGLFARGLCLPSGSSLSDAEVDRVVEVIAAARR
jgi:pyridoxal phosphate-dependent aminotransferase EpsN